MKGVRAVMVGVLAAGAVGAHAQEAARGLEPETEYEASPWWDAWWLESTVAGPAAARGTAHGLAEERAVLGEALSNGIVVNRETVTPGVPGALRSARDGAVAGMERSRENIRNLPARTREAAGHVVEGHRQAARAVTGHADAARESGAEHVDAMGTAPAEHSSDIRALWSRVATERADALERADGTRQFAAQRLAHDVGDARSWVGGQLGDAGNTFTERGARVVRLPLDTAPPAMAFAFSETSSIARRTGEATGQEIRASRALVDDAGRRGRVEMEDAGDRWVNRLSTAAATAGDERERAAGRVEIAGRAADESHRAQVKRTRERTFARVPGALAHAAAETELDARRLYHLGWDEYLVGGFQLAGDNYFAGDVEGVAVGSFYSASAVGQGGGTLLVLEPVAAAGNLGAGAGHAGALLGAGGLRMMGLAMARVVGSVAFAGWAAAVLVGTELLANARLLGNVGMGAMDVAATSLVGAARVAGTWTAGALTSAATLAGGMGTAAGMLLLGLAGAVGLGVVAPVLAGGWVVAHAGAHAGSALVHGTAVVTAVAMLAGLRVLSASLELGARALALETSRWVGSAWHVSAAVTVVVFHAVAMAARWVVEMGVAAPFHAVAEVVGGFLQAGWTMASAPVASALVTWGSILGPLALGHVTVVAAGVRFTLGSAGQLVVGAARVAHHAGRTVLSGAVRGVDGITAPFRFSRQLRWRAERQPQLEELLARQDADVRERVGTEVTYVRVIQSGEDRGKVNFFDTGGGARTWRFHRRVAADCAVHFVSGTTVLDSGWDDAACVAARQEQEVRP